MGFSRRRGALSGWEPGWMMEMGVITLLKTNMDTPNDGLEKVSPFKNGNFGYPR